MYETLLLFFPLMVLNSISLFFNYFTRYSWLYPLKLKRDVPSIFLQFQKLAEIKFDSKIKSLYTKGGTKFIQLKNHLQNHGISHYISLPYTLQHVGLVEYRHSHIVEIGLTLLYHTFFHPHFWSYAFLHSIYLINQMPTPPQPTPHLFNAYLVIYHLYTFGCLCYPWLKPYSSHKLSTKSRLCIFLDFSI